jgi:hypothetical protein
MAFAYALGLASKLATRIGDATLASTYSITKAAIEATLNGTNINECRSLDWRVYDGGTD